VAVHLIGNVNDQVPQGLIDNNLFSLLGFPIENRSSVKADIMHFLEAHHLGGKLHLIARCSFVTTMLILHRIRQPSPRITIMGDCIAALEAAWCNSTASENP
jgi:hypothetical protein